MFNKLRYKNIVIDNIDINSSEEYMVFRIFSLFKYLDENEINNLYKIYNSDFNLYKEKFSETYAKYYQLIKVLDSIKKIISFKIKSNKINTEINFDENGYAYNPILKYISNIETDLNQLIDEERQYLSDNCYSLNLKKK